MSTPALHQVPNSLVGVLVNPHYVPMGAAWSLERDNDVDLSKLTDAQMMDLTSIMFLDHTGK